MSSGLSAPALATDAPAKDPAVNYAQALELYRADDFAAAARAFEEAYLLDPSPVLLVNAARAWERAGDKRRATRQFQGVLRLDGITEEVASAAERGMERLTGPPGLEAPAGAWYATGVAIGDRDVDITMLLMPAGKRGFEGTFHVAEVHCGGRLKAKALKKGRLEVKVTGTAGHTLCAGLGDVTLTVEDDGLNAHWKRDGASELLLSFAADPPAADSEVADLDTAPSASPAVGDDVPGAASGPGRPPQTHPTATDDLRAPASTGPRPSTRTVRTPRTRRKAGLELIIAGDVAAAERALKVLPQWIGRMMLVTFHNGRTARGKVQFVRGTQVGIRLDNGTDWQGDVVQVRRIRLL